MVTDALPMGMTDKDPYPEGIKETTSSWPDEPVHEDIVVGGEGGKDEFPEELLEDVDEDDRDEG
ncbi:hypothetical protein GCM10009020_28910 [Natronoarchaeum mannanilyticum]|uniref:Uncharacterized protein n=2 Tax=Natronoarchaeum mannanilyticum TaxID=926360 RepID=A0AAV3TDQ2_9EURY